MKRSTIQAKIQVHQDRYEEIKGMSDEEYTEEVRAELKALVKDMKGLNEDLKALEDAEILMEDFSRPEAAAKDTVFAKVHEDKEKPEIQVKEQHTYKSFGDQLMDVYTVANVNAPSDQRNKASLRLEDIRNAATGMGESVPSDGGFLVQTDYSTELLKRTYETGLLVKDCTRIPISANSNSAVLPQLDDASRANGSRWGGIRTYWEGEGDAITASRPKFGNLEMKLKKLTGLCYATDELLQDAQLLDTYITKGFSEEFGFRFDDSIVRGPGAGTPLGILNAGSLVSQAKETGQVADTITSENVEKMFARMEPRSLGRAKWYINQECWPQIFQLHHSVGTGGVPMYVEPGKLNQAPNGTLLGRPIEVIEQCSALGDLGDILFLDLSRYLWADKGALQAATSVHVRFVYDETAFRFIARVDGQPMYDSAVTPYKGAATQSPFIGLANRA